MKSSTLVSTYRLFLGCCMLWMVAMQLFFSMRNTGISLNNFLSFFTIQANLFGGVMLLLLARSPVTTRREKRWLVVARSAALFYLAVSTIYLSYFFLSQNEITALTLPWTSWVFRLVFPVLFLIDYLSQPPKMWLSWQDTQLWFVYPVFYILWSLVGGAIHGWYPYAFLDPKPAGLSDVLLSVVIIGVGMIPISQAIIWLNNQSYKKTRS